MFSLPISTSWSGMKEMEEFWGTHWCSGMEKKESRIITGLLAWVTVVSAAVMGKTTEMWDIKQTSVLIMLGLKWSLSVYFGDDMVGFMFPVHENVSTTDLNLATWNLKIWYWIRAPK